MICSVLGCAAVATRRKMCRKHYRSFMRYGDPTTAKPRRKRGEGCVRADGYGVIQIDNKTTLMHRLAWEQANGRKLRPEEVVHHKDGCPRNNDPNNLVVFASQSEHLSFHNELRKGIRNVQSAR